jgi:hypothetical protein
MSANARSGTMLGPTNSSVIAGNLEFYLSVWQQSQAAANFLGNRHLAFACNPHRITPAGKSNTSGTSLQAFAVLARYRFASI